MEPNDDGGIGAGKKQKTELDLEVVSARKVEPPPPPHAPAGEEPSKKKPRAEKKRVLVIACLVVSLAVTSVALTAATSRYSTKKKEAAAKLREDTAKKPGENAPAPAAPAQPLDKPAPTYNFTMEPFIFQCGNNGENRFIRLGLTFQMSNEEALAEAGENTPLLRRSVTFYLKTRDANELLYDRTRRKILDEIRGNIDKSLKNGRATAVFVDEFVVY